MCSLPGREDDGKIINRLSAADSDSHTGAIRALSVNYYVVVMF